MPVITRNAYGAERRAAREAEREGDVQLAWRHLERSHVIAQPFPVGHVGSHVAMLQLARRVHERREVRGQVVRIVLAGPASLSGRIPTGNSGRAAVPLKATMPIPADLLDLVGGG